MTQLRRFGPEFVAAHRDRHGRGGRDRRQLTYDIAVKAEYEPWRLWYDDQLAALPSDIADGLERRLWLDEHFWPVTFELATGAALRETGLQIAYERELDGSTPD